MYWIVAFLLIVASLMEAMFFRIPLVLIALLLLFVLYRETWLFVAALLSGLLLDLLLLQTVGLTSIVFILFLFVVFLYEKKFEIASQVFIGIAIFLGSLVLFLVYAEGIHVLSALSASALAILLYTVMRHYLGKTAYDVW